MEKLGPTVAPPDAHPCVSATADGARFALHPPTAFRLAIEEDAYKLLVPFGRAAMDVALSDAPPRRLVLRPGDLIFAKPGVRLSARHLEPIEFLVVVLDPRRVRRVAEMAAGPGWQTRDLVPWHDLAAVVLGSEMRRILLSEGVPSASYLAALADALVARVVVQTSAEQPRAERHALAPVKLARVIRHIDASLEGPITNTELADLADLSPAHFARAFMKATGDPPHRFIMKRRICRARDLLSEGDGSIAEIAVRTGFSSQAHLSTAFIREVGTTPGAYRSAFRQGRDGGKPGDAPGLD